MRRAWSALARRALCVTVIAAAVTLCRAANVPRAPLFFNPEGSFAGSWHAASRDPPDSQATEWPPPPVEWAARASSRGSMSLVLDVRQLLNSTLHAVQGEVLLRVGAFNTDDNLFLALAGVYNESDRSIMCRLRWHEGGVTSGAHAMSLAAPWPSLARANASHVAAFGDDLHREWRAAEAGEAARNASSPTPVLVDDCAMVGRLLLDAQVVALSLQLGPDDMADAEVSSRGTRERRVGAAGESIAPSSGVLGHVSDMPVPQDAMPTAAESGADGSDAAGSYATSRAAGASIGAALRTEVTLPAYREPSDREDAFGASFARVWSDGQHMWATPSVLVAGSGKAAVRMRQTRAYEHLAANRTVVMRAWLLSVACPQVTVALDAEVSETKAFVSRALGFAALVLAGTLAQLVVTVRQIHGHRGQRSLSRLSALAFTMLTAMDSYMAMVCVTASVVFEEVFAGFSAAAFLCLALWSVFELRFLLTIVRAARGATPGDERGIHTDDLSARVTVLVIGMLLTMLSTRWLFRLALFAVCSFWLPQIVKQARMPGAPVLDRTYVVITTLTRLSTPLYMFGVRDNVFRLQPSAAFCVAISLWMSVLAAGVLLTARPSGEPNTVLSRLLRVFRGPQYDYHRELPVAYEHGDCVICMSAVDTDSPAPARMVTPCNHVFHTDCLTQWMDVKLECPTCRARLPALGEAHGDGDAGPARPDRPAVGAAAPAAGAPRRRIVLAVDP